MGVTAKDIAEGLNLSQPTVSRILSGDTAQRVSADTRARVLQAAREMGYRPNALARSLRRGRTGCVGLYATYDYDARNDFYAAVLSGLQHACRAHGLDMLLFCANEAGAHGAHSAQDIEARLHDGRIDGLFLHASEDDALVRSLAQSSLPVVALSDARAGIPSVSCDNESGMHALLDGLWARGNRDFVFVAPEIRLSSVERRVNAYTDWLTPRVSSHARRVVRIPFENAEDRFQEICATSNERLAVCCWNDRTAYNFLRAASKRGVQVPQQVAVAGFDGFLDEKLPALQLSTVVVPWEELMRTAMRLLQRQINGERVEAEVQMPGVLSWGNTT